MGSTAAASHTRVFIGPRLGPYPYWYGYPYGYYDYNGRYVFGDNVGADSQGYYDGLKTGEADARHGRSYDPERSHYFRNASSVTSQKLTVPGSSVDIVPGSAVK